MERAKVINLLNKFFICVNNLAIYYYLFRDK